MTIRPTEDATLIPHPDNADIIIVTLAKNMHDDESLKLRDQVKKAITGPGKHIVVDAGNLVHWNGVLRSVMGQIHDHVTAKGGTMEAINVSYKLGQELNPKIRKFPPPQPGRTIEQIIAEGAKPPHERGWASSHGSQLR